MDLQEAIQAFHNDLPHLIARGVSYEFGMQPRAYVPDGWAGNLGLAMDAQPGTVTDPNSAIPWWFTNLIDPQVYEAVFAPNNATEILDEQRRGTWVDQTAMFPINEFMGETAAYGDYNENGQSNMNANWPQRQSFLFQTNIRYGDLEVDRAGAAKINWVQGLKRSAAMHLNKISNFTYFFGVNGLQCYGMLNDPNLPAPLTPAPKAYGPGSTRWITGGVVTATANEIFLDIETVVIALITQTTGYVNSKSKMKLAMSPQMEGALATTNSFGISVNDMIKKNYPNLEIATAVQYGAQSASNPQGVVAGNLMQLWAQEIEGQKVAFCAFNEKMREHRLIPATSSYRQKITGGTWGTVIRMPVGVAQMLGL